MLGETIVVREKEGTFDKHGYDHDFGVECFGLMLFATSMNIPSNNKFYFSLSPTQSIGIP